MARLIVRSGNLQSGPFELKWGVTRLGRAPGNDIPIDHDSVSGAHCEIHLSTGGVTVRNSGSTNGTFIDGARLVEAPLRPGQRLRVGDVEFELGLDESAVSVPAPQVTHAAASSTLADGTRSCVNHPTHRSTWRCTRCGRMLCDACIHELKRIGGGVLNLCPACSGPCQPVVWSHGDDGRKSFLGRLADAITRPFRKD